MTKTIDILICKNKQKLEPCYEKRELQSQSYTIEDQEL